MSKQYEEIKKLLTETAKNIADLGDLLKSPSTDDMSPEEQKELQLGLLKLVVVIKEFGRGGDKIGN